MPPCALYPRKRRTTASASGQHTARHRQGAVKEPTIEIDEDMAWELTAMSVSHLGAKGCYHMSAGMDGHLNVFVALMDVRSEKE